MTYMTCMTCMTNETYMTRKVAFITLFALTFLLSCNTVKKNAVSPISIDPYHYTVQKKVLAENGAVVSAHPLASKVGVEILKMGGNAVDAAIAVQLALAVVYPQAGNLGGGGFMVAKLDNGKLIALDYREKAP